jgi:hypothetical protein
VLVAEHTRLAVRALHTSELVGECSGRWIDAALGPDGSRLVAIDFAGRIRVHLVEPELPVAYEIPADTPAQAVAASDDRIAVAFIEPPLVRTAALPDA